MQNVVISWSDILPLLYAAFAFGGAYMAVRTEMRHVWKTLGKIEQRLDKAHDRIDDHERTRHNW